ncbi:MAG: TonB-dependent receptor [Pseudomonadales bacterium]
MKSLLTKSGLAIAVAGTCFTGNALAQTVLEEVVVTANKREQSLREIPTSITAMTGNMLEDRGITEAKDLHKIVPSMITGVGNRGEPTINIRGVGYNEVGSPGVAIHVDGVYQPNPGMGLIAQYDIERVEILRGPQSTLYGRNANGGVVNYLTKSPDDEFGGSVTLGIADYGQTRISGSLNMPISDDWGVRLSLTGMQRDDGFYENILPTGPDTGKIDHSYGGRLVIDGDINDAVSLKLTATFADNETSPNSTVTLAPSYNPALANDPIATGDFKIAHGGDNSRETTYEALSVIVNWSLSEIWSLTSISGYQAHDVERFGDFDFLETNLILNQVDEENQTFTQEFNLAGSLGAVDTVFGLFYLDDAYENYTQFTFPSGFGPLPPSNEPLLRNLVPYYDTTSVALYADGSWNVSEDFRLLVGIRYSDDEQSVGQDLTVFGPPGRVPCSAGTVVQTDIDGTSTIGRLGGQYDLTDNSNVYATYSEGVKTGGVNRASCQDVFEDEEVKSYELGYKMQSEDGSFAANITAFFYDYTNLQTNQILGLVSSINNAPGAEVLGLELDGLWRPDEHWTISASLSLLDATYSEEFLNTNAAIAPVVVGPPPAPGAPPVTEVTVADVNGNRLNYAPEVSGNFSIGYRTDPIFSEGTLDLRLDANYRSEVTLREFDLESDRTDTITLVGVSAKWTSASENYSVRLYVDNLTDEGYYEFASAASQSGYAFATWNTPRQYGLEFNVNF